MVRKKIKQSYYYKFGMPLLVAIAGWSAFDLIRGFFITSWETYFGIFNANLQSLLTFITILLIIWLLMGAPFTKKGFIRVVDKIL